MRRSPRPRSWARPSCSPAPTRSSVYGAAILAGLALTLVRPAHASVLPTIARTPSELTAANVATGTVENVGVLVGSVAGGVLLAEAGTAGVWLAAGVGLGLGFLAVVGMRPAVVVRRQRLELTLDDVGPGPAIPVPGAIDAVHAADAALVASPRGGGAVLAEILAGLRVIRAEPNLRVVVLVLGLSMCSSGSWTCSASCSRSRSSMRATRAWG